LRSDTFLKPDINHIFYRAAIIFSWMRSFYFCRMEIIYLMLIVSLLVALFFLASFIWAVRSNQFEDDYSPSVRILFDDAPLSQEAKPSHESSQDDENSEKTDSKKIKTNGNRKI